MPRHHLVVESLLRDVVGRAHRTRNLVVRDAAPEAAARRIWRRHRRYQLLCVGMLRVLDDRGARADLDDLAKKHHRNAVADALDDRDVVRDEQEGQAHLRLEAQHQVEDARLYGDVERRHNLVGDDQLRPERERPGDGDALALAAGELVRVTPGHVGGQAHLPQQVGHAVGRLATRGDAMDKNGLGDCGADGLLGIEARKRVLENHLHSLTHLAQAPWIKGTNILFVEKHAPAAWLDEPQNRATSRGFSAAGFAHESERLARMQRKGHVLDRVHAPRHPAEDAGADGKTRDEIGHLEDGAVSGARGYACFAPSQRSPEDVAWRRSLPRLRLWKWLRQRLAFHRAEARNRCKQRLGIGMLRLFQHLRRRALLNLLALPHHYNAISNLGDHAHVMGDEYDRHALLVLQQLDQFEDFSLHGYVEHGGRLVCDEQLRLAGERHGDHYALAHAAREAMRIFVEALARRRHAHAFEDAQSLRLGRLAVELAMVDQCLGDLEADGEHWVEARHRLLEDHRGGGAAHIAHLLFRQLQYIPPVEADGAFDLAVRLRQKAHNGERRDALAGAGLAHDRDGLARAHVEGQALDGRTPDAVGAEEDREVADGKHRLGRGAHERRLSPSRLEMTTAIEATLGGHISFLRRRPKTIASGRISRHDSVVPFGMKGIAGYVEGRHFLVGDFDAFWIGVGIEFAADRQAGLGCGVGDQFDRDDNACERRSTPVLGDVAEHTVLDLLPLGGAWRIRADV